MASGPQIVKLYASGDVQGMYRLANNTSKFSAFLFILLAIPVFLEIDYILYIWLGQVPDYTSYFARTTIIQSMITCLYQPHTTAMNATGHIKWHNITVGGVLLLIVPVTYILLRLHVSLEIVYAVNVIPWAIASLIMIKLLQHYTHIDPWDAYRKVYLKVFYILILCFIPSYVLHLQLPYGTSRLLIVVGFSLIWSGVVIYWLGLPKHIRKELLSKIVTNFTN